MFGENNIRKPIPNIFCCSKTELIHVHSTVIKKGMYHPSIFMTIMMHLMVPFTTPRHGEQNETK